MAQWIVKGKYGSKRAERLDSFSTQREAMAMAGEYAMAYGPGWTIWVEEPKKRGKPGGSWRMNPGYELVHYIVELTPSGDTKRVVPINKNREGTHDWSEATQIAGNLNHFWREAIESGVSSGFEVVSEPGPQKNPGGFYEMERKLRRSWEYENALRALLAKNDSALSRAEARGDERAANELRREHMKLRQALYASQRSHG